MDGVKIGMVEIRSYSAWKDSNDVGRFDNEFNSNSGPGGIIVNSKIRIFHASVKMSSIICFL